MWTLLCFWWCRTMGHQTMDQHDASLLVPFGLKIWNGREWLLCFTYLEKNSLSKKKTLEKHNTDQRAKSLSSCGLIWSDDTERFKEASCGSSAAPFYFVIASSFHAHLLRSYSPSLATWLHRTFSHHPDLANNLCKSEIHNKKRSASLDRGSSQVHPAKPFLLNHELGRAIISLTCNQFQKPKAHCCKPNLSPSNKHTSLHLKAEVQSYYSLCWLQPLIKFSGGWQKRLCDVHHPSSCNPIGFLDKGKHSYQSVSRTTWS